MSKPLVSESLDTPDHLAIGVREGSTMVAEKTQFVVACSFIGKEIQAIDELTECLFILRSQPRKISKHLQHLSCRLENLFQPFDTTRFVTTCGEGKNCSRYFRCLCCRGL